MTETEAELQYAPLFLGKLLQRVRASVPNLVLHHSDVWKEIICAS